MRKKRTYIIILLILVAFFIIMFYLFGLDDYKESKNTATLILSDNTVWSYKNRRWANISNFSDVQKLNWKKYHVFTEQEKIGDYYLWYDDKWYVFDNNKNAIQLEGDLFAYKANYDISISGFEMEEISDNDRYVSSILEEHNIKLDKFTSHFKIPFDFDNDGVVEEFYVISNVFALDFQPETVFSIVFMVKNDQIYSIYEDISPNYSLNGCKPYFQNFLDVNHDSSYEFILSCGYYSDTNRADMLYQFVNNKFKILISN